MKNEPIRQEDILWNLCSKDRRYPLWDDLYGDYEVPPEPRGNCFCDSCYSGRDVLAVEILRLQELLEEKRKRGYIHRSNTAAS
jgi:hypothetical protein